MGIFVAAWLFGEGLVVYRWRKLGAPPTPGALLLPSVIFVALGVLADYPPARSTAAALAVAVDLAVAMQVIGKAPTGTTGWPPPLMADPTTTVFPDGGASGTAAAAGTGAPSGQAGQNALQANPGNLKPVPGMPGVYELPG